MKRKRKSKLPARIRAARLAANLTQVQVAKAAKTSQTYLSDLERAERRPSLDVLERIARALGTSASELLADRN